MDVLRVDGTCYIWYARGKHPYSIDLSYKNPIAIRDNTIMQCSEELQKTGIAEIVKWEYLPKLVRNCIISMQEVLMEEKESTPY